MGDGPALDRLSFQHGNFVSLLLIDLLRICLKDTPEDMLEDIFYGWMPEKMLRQK